MTILGDRDSSKGKDAELRRGSEAEACKSRCVGRLGPNGRRFVEPEDLGLVSDEDLPGWGRGLSGNVPLGELATRGESLGLLPLDDPAVVV